MVRLCIKQSVRAATETHATYFARGDKGREKGREGKGGGRAGKRRRWWREWKRQRKTRSRTRCLVVFQVGACVCVCPCPMLFLSVRVSTVTVWVQNFCCFVFCSSVSCCLFSRRFSDGQLHRVYGFVPVLYPRCILCCSRGLLYLGCLVYRACSMFSHHT